MFEKRLSKLALPKALDLVACDQEPIHVPSSIQPHGMLLVVDLTSDIVLQAASDATLTTDPRFALPGRSVREILGISLSDLVQQAETTLRLEPVYLGTVGPFDERGKLTITAHCVQGLAVVEAEPAFKPASAAATLASIRSITELVGGAFDLIEACKLAASELQRIIGYDRVMIYQFLPDGTGSVIAEKKGDGLSSLLNHRYPASDIPKQARELYIRNLIRTIPNVGYTPTALMPRLSSPTNLPLDMSHCVLRGISPVHIRYLKNMGVGASMSVSLLPRGNLWGLIACHNTTAKLIPYEAREGCRHVGQILSQQIRAHEDADSHTIAVELGAARDRVMQVLDNSDDPYAALLGLCPTLQQIVLSHGVAVCRKDTVVTAGAVPSEAQVSRLAKWLRKRLSGIDLFLTHCLPEEYAEAGAFASVASGLLSILLPGDNPLLFMWFRAEQIEEINWAGNPHEALESGSSLGALNPRKSFTTWRETVRGSARPWTSVEIESAQTFRLRVALNLQLHKAHELNQLLHEANERLATLALTDGLTGVANRRAFDERLKTEWARATRIGNSLALITLDVDFFKQYNDHFGHPIGDQCLRQVAHALERERAADFAARIGGEEFSLLLPDTDIRAALAIAETVRSRIERLHIAHPKSPLAIVTASFGVAVATPGQVGSPEDLSRAADHALYQAKRSGRNRVVHF
jgi:two-component system, chemotaxis family, sensor kinase Cph1